MATATSFCVPKVTVFTLISPLLLAVTPSAPCQRMLDSAMLSMAPIWRSSTQSPPVPVRSSLAATSAPVSRASDSMNVSPAASPATSQP